MSLRISELSPGARERLEQIRKGIEVLVSEGGGPDSVRINERGDCWLYADIPLSLLPD